MSSPKLISSFLASAVIAIPVFALGMPAAFASSVESSPVQVPPSGGPSPTTPTPSPAPTPAPAPTPNPTPGNPSPAPTTPPIHS